MKSGTTDVVEIISPLGPLRLRPEQPTDAAFRFELFCQSCPPEFALLQIELAALEQLMRFQFESQTTTYRLSFPNARFDIIERDRIPVGRVVVDRRDDALHIVDLAIVPALRGHGCGGAIMRALMDEAGRAGRKVMFKVAVSNEATIRLHQRLGFTVTATEPSHVEMEWRGISS